MRPQARANRPWEGDDHIDASDARGLQSHCAFCDSLWRAPAKNPEHDAGR